MIRRFTLISIILLAAMTLWYLQFGRDIVVCNSQVVSCEDGKTESISVIANRIYIFDKEEFANQVLQRYLDNSFKEIRFSFDIGGYPNELCIEVYLNQMDWKLKKKSFEFRIRNIADYMEGEDSNLNSFFDCFSHILMLFYMHNSNIQQLL